MYVLNNGERKREREAFICGFCCVRYGVDMTILYFFFFFVDIFIFIFSSFAVSGPTDVHVAQTIPLFLWVCVFLVSNF